MDDTGHKTPVIRRRGRKTTNMGHELDKQSLSRTGLSLRQAVVSCRINQLTEGKPDLTVSKLARAVNRETHILSGLLIRTRPPPSPARGRSWRATVLA
jgi:hypothetical protein